MQWNEPAIAHALARQIFRKGLVSVPATSWPGNECDLLVLTENLLLIDVEIKISRADFKADAKKDKWQGYITRSEREDGVTPPRLDWPRKVWKHYYAIPADVWRDGLEECAGSPQSGIITLRHRGFRTPEGLPRIHAAVVRRAKPNPDAKPATAAQVAEIARLGSLRMWDALRLVSSTRQQVQPA